MYEILLTGQAAKQLKSIKRGDPKLYEQIDKAITALEANPRPDGCTALSGRSGYRIRVRQYRVLYTVNDKAVEVEVFRVGGRGSVYQ